MVTQSQAGPSRRRGRDESSDYDSDGDGYDEDVGTLRRSEVFATMDPREKQRVTRALQGLQTRTDTMLANLENVEADQVLEVLRGANKLSAEGKDADVATVDAHLFRGVTDLTSALITKSKIGGDRFEIDQFLLNVKNVLGIDTLDEEEHVDSQEEDELESDRPRRRRRMGREELGDWTQLGWLASSFDRRAPGVEFLNGPLSVEHKRKEKRARQRQELAPEQRPVEIQTQRGENNAPHDRTLTNVRSVDAALKRQDRGEGINFFEFVCNPESFSQSVENCFYVAFLIHEGKAGIDVLDDGMVVISAREPYVAGIDDDGNEEDPTRHQAVLELEHATWAEAIKVFDIRKPMIPTRQPTVLDAPAAGAWYGA